MAVLISTDVVVRDGDGAVHGVAAAVAGHGGVVGRDGGAAAARGGVVAAVDRHDVVDHLMLYELII